MVAAVCADGPVNCQLLLSPHTSIQPLFTLALLVCRVSDVMTPDPLVVRPETNIEAAARILLQKKVRRLPVVDDSGRLIGMFTRGDVIKAALRARKAVLEKAVKAK